ncbi:hypothetical protein A0U92_03510 [Acetobacter aceti]|uniref:Uncharacterized protein n=1 Tax=Acetobacter aceti TaxID=435 RepID=A0A1U9KE09_ACEAC|nr:hypothetical protein A0U92_03510 [Acetobacter aceti]
MSGRISCAGMPDNAATFWTWISGTRFQPRMVEWLLPISEASLDGPPAARMIFVRSVMTQCVAYTDTLRQYIMSSLPTRRLAQHDIVNS